MLRRPRALSLDLDETLLDNSGIPESIAQTCAAIEARFPLLDATQLVQANTEAWSAYWPEVEEACWLGRMDGASVVLNAWDRTLSACGCRDEGVLRFAFETHRRLGREAHRPFADVGDFLAYVAETDLRLALLTNGPSDLQREKLSALGLEDPFDAVVISADVGMAKPDPAVFATVVRGLGVEPREIWHIGDGLTTDVAGARSSGLGAVWLNRHGRPLGDDGARPDLEVASLRELVKVLGRE